MEGQGEKKPGGHISKFEWYFLIAVFAVVDTIAFILDFFVVGVAINRFIDILSALLISTYVIVRRAHMDTRAWGSIGGAFLGEMVPILDALPLWTLDIVYLYSINNSDTTAVLAGQALTVGMKGQLSGGKAPTGAVPPIIREQAAPGAVPPKISGGKQQLPRRIPSEPGVGEEARPPIINNYRKTPPPLPNSGNARPPVIENYGKTPPRVDTYGKTPPVIAGVQAPTGAVPPIIREQAAPGAVPPQLVTYGKTPPKISQNSIAGTSTESGPEKGQNESRQKAHGNQFSVSEVDVEKARSALNQKGIAFGDKVFDKGDNLEGGRRPGRSLFTIHDPERSQEALNALKSGGVDVRNYGVA